MKFTPGSRNQAFRVLAEAAHPDVADALTVHRIDPGEQLRPEPGNAKLPRLSPPGLGAENDHQAARKSMSHALNVHPIGGLETIVKFLDLGNLTTLAKVREIVREAKLDVHLRHIVFMD